MFDTLERQYLNKLTEGEVRDFPSPKTFHRIKVQCLGDDGIKPSAEIRRTFVVPVLALIGNLGVKPCEVSHRTPPIVRTSNLSADRFVEVSKLVQGVFQGLGMLDLLTCIQRQIRLHTEVYPYAFTCSRQHFFGGIICHDIKPILTGSIPADLDITDVPLPIAMVVIQDMPTDKHKLLFIFRPFFERQANRAFRNRKAFFVLGFHPNLVAGLKFRRTEFATAFELRGSDTSVSASTLFYPIKEPFVADMDTDNHSVKCITRYPCPVWMRALEQLRQVRLQPISASVFAVDAVISLLQCQKVVVDIFKVIEHITQAHILRVIANLFFVRSAILFLLFHGISRITSLTPVLWVGPTRYQAVTQYMSVQRDTYIKPHFTKNAKVFFKKTPWSHAQGRTFLPNLKDGVSSPKI